MERIPVTASRLLVSSCVVGVLVAAAAVATAAPVPARNLTKTRQGSLLKSEKPWEQAPDLRGEAERTRDRELATHYGRMAELDVLANLASDGRDIGLMEWVEQVRRKELERHHLVMMRLQRGSRAALATGAR